MNTLIFLDYAARGQITFQDSGTSIMQGIVNLHHHIFFFIVMILIFVFVMLHQTYIKSTWHYKPYLTLYFPVSYNWWRNYNFNETKNLVKKAKLYGNLNVTHGTTLEIIWTIAPSLILLFIVGPSFQLLYAIDGALDPVMTIKAIGHQWYWTYEYTDSFAFLENLENKLEEEHEFLNNAPGLQKLRAHENFFMVQPNLIQDSYMKATTDLELGELRLLEVDNPLLLPLRMPVRLDITSDDVLHSFAVPSLGVKVDAVPGRLNVAYIQALRNGIFFGQCSEICGVNHGYMPIKVRVEEFSDIVTEIFTAQDNLINQQGEDGICVGSFSGKHLKDLWWASFIDMTPELGITLNGQSGNLDIDADVDLLK